MLGRDRHGELDISCTFAVAADFWMRICVLTWL